jgi:hypothetical protein
LKGKFYLRKVLIFLREFIILKVAPKGVKKMELIQLMVRIIFGLSLIIIGILVYKWGHKKEVDEYSRMVSSRSELAEVLGELIILFGVGYILFVISPFFSQIIKYLFG